MLNLFYPLFGVLLVASVVGGFIWVQMKARLGWRLLSIAILTIWCCCAVTKFARTDVYREITENYMRFGLPQFVENIEKLAVEGRTNEVVKACERFQREFEISDDHKVVTNFWDLVSTTYAVTLTNSP